MTHRARAFAVLDLIPAGHPLRLRGHKYSRTMITDDYEAALRWSMGDSILLGFRSWEDAKKTPKFPEPKFVFDNQILSQ